ncbi:hypothetical protein STENM223S_03174 [Streptomyces tendae]
MAHPDPEILLRLPTGLYRCRTPRFGALIGDGVQTGSRITLGAGTAIGRACHIYSHTVIGPTTVVPARSTVTPTDRPTQHAHPRREMTNGAEPSPSRARARLPRRQAPSTWRIQYIWGNTANVGVPDVVGQLASGINDASP